MTTENHTSKKPRFDSNGDASHRDMPGRYLYVDESLPLAINAALATSRPLLLRGEPGSGKSTVARDVASKLGWRYYEQVVGSRMTANDLLWRFDAVRRLSDAQSSGGIRPIESYIMPQPLWQTLRPESASNFGRREPDDAGQGAVLLLDEIDKADPDVPNDLLVVLGEGRFVVTDADKDIDLGTLREHRLLVITTNGEREPPAAFLRRCVSLTLETPRPDALRRIAISHMPELADNSHLDGWIARMWAIREACKSNQHKPGTAEILDGIRACHELGVTTSEHPHWTALTLAMGWKNPEAPPDKLKQSELAR